MSAARAKTPEPTKVERPLSQAVRMARSRAVPLLGIETPDPASTRVAITEAVPAATPIVEWDALRGLTAPERSPGAIALAAAISAARAQQALTIKASTMLDVLQHVPGELRDGDGKVTQEGAIVLVHGAQELFRDPVAVQGIWNLRDQFKRNRRTLILLGPTLKYPASLTGDIITLDEPLPTRALLRPLVEQQYQNAKLAEPDEATVTKALDAIVGLPSFTAEQVTAMSLTPRGLDIPKLWGHKIKAIKQTPGLSVWEGKNQTLDTLKGIDNVVAFAKMLIAADVFRAIVFVDEGDKAFAGGMSDYVGDSGVSKDAVGQVLTYMADTEALGLLLAGLAGTGKTELGKAIASAAGRPLVLLDLGGMKGGHVGDSERMVRNALKMVTAIAEGRVLFIMTANRTTTFTPEMNRRFPDQFFFDHPDAAGRAAIWPVYEAQYGLTPAQAARPEGFDTGWTGAEIKRVAERAAMFKTTVVEAARWLVPQAESAKKVIREMRESAHGRFLSASYPGWYQYQDTDLVVPGAPLVATTRDIVLEEK